MMVEEKNTIRVLDTPCLVTDSADLTDRITRHVKGSHPLACSVDFTNVHIVAMRKINADFREKTSKVDWFVPDSQILTWAATWLGAQGNQRVYGPEFLDYFVRHADEALTHYFLGASSTCLEQLIVKLKEKRPELKIVGWHDGYFKEEDESAINDDIKRACPDVVWVGLGTPKQQEWIHRNQESLKVGALLAVGFAFDVNAGTKSDAPQWMGKMGVLWLYRFLCEPRRLFKRYAIYNTVFLWHLLRQVMRFESSRR